MNLKSGVILVAGLFYLCIAIAQGDVDYKNRALKKTLQKAGMSDLSVIEEIEIPDSIFSENSIKGKYFLIKESNVSKYQYIYIGRVNSCRAGGCSISNEISKEGNSEYFDYYIIFDKNKTVKSIKVFNYQATHGHEITAKGWLKQFIGHDGRQPLQVDKNIDAISGATISVYAITFDVQTKTEILKQILNCGIAKL